MAWGEYATGHGGHAARDAGGTHRAWAGRLRRARRL